MDVLKTAALIQDHYEAFKEAIGVDFDPLELALSLREKDSIFWKKLKGQAHLWGLLFGFGKMNSYLFQWNHFDSPPSYPDFCEKSFGYLSEDSFKKEVKHTIENFPLPAFMSFNAIDPIVERFKEERDRIKEIYKGQDFLELTLKKIME